MPEGYKNYRVTFFDKDESLDVEKNNEAYCLYSSIDIKVMDIPRKNGETDYVISISLSDFGRNLDELIK